MSEAIKIREVKCELALPFSENGTLKFFNTLNARILPDLQMTLEGDRLHIRTAREEYFVWGSNLVYAKPEFPAPLVVTPEPAAPKVPKRK